MNKRSRLLYLGVNVVILVLLYSCTKDKGALPRQMAPAPTPVVGSECGYANDVKPFVLLKCAISGCHRAGFPFGNFTLYADLKIKVDAGRVKTLVFDNQLMPPAGAVPLTEQEREKLKCWMNNGARED